MTPEELSQLLDWNKWNSKAATPPVPLGAPQTKTKDISSMMQPNTSPPQGTPTQGQPVVPPQATPPVPPGAPPLANLGPQSVADINRAKGEPAGGKYGVTTGHTPTPNEQYIKAAEEALKSGAPITPLGDQPAPAAVTAPVKPVVPAKPVSPAAQKIAAGTVAAPTVTGHTGPEGEIPTAPVPSTFMNKPKLDPYKNPKDFWANALDILQGKNTVLGALRGQAANEDYKGPGPLSKAFQSAGAALSGQKPAYLEEENMANQLAIKQKEVESARAMKEYEAKNAVDMENLKSSNEFKNATAEEKQRMEDQLAAAKDLELWKKEHGMLPVGNTTQGMAQGYWSK